MAVTLARLLEKRSNRGSAGLRYIFFSMLCHCLVWTALWFSPELFARSAHIDSYSMMVVPPLMLGELSSRSQVRPESQPETLPPGPEPALDHVSRSEEKVEAEGSLDRNGPPSVRPRSLTETLPPGPEPAPDNTSQSDEKADVPLEPNGSSDTEKPARLGSPVGKFLGTSTNRAILGVEDPNFTYTYYPERIVAAISSNWVRPPLPGHLEAWIHFRVLRNGTIVDLRLVESSTSTEFDTAALRAVAASSPLPPLPKGYQRDNLGINLIIR